jgi:hypothetical protein
VHPTCTHAYALRNHTVAAALLAELGHDLATTVDTAMARLLEVRRAELPSFVMLPPPVTQLYRTGKHFVRFAQQVVRGQAATLLHRTLPVCTIASQNCALPGLLAGYA